MKQLSNDVLSRKVLLSRMRVLSKYPFYGLMLMNMKLTIEDDCDTAYTDSSKIAFGREFLTSLKDSEVDFILMHELLHVVLKHCFRGLDYDHDLFNIACDIVVNSTIFESSGYNLDAIKVDGNVSIHEIDGFEGNKFTAEEVYERLLKKKDLIEDRRNNELKNNSSESNSKGDESKSNNVSNEKTKNDLTNEDVIDDHSKWDGIDPYKEDLVDRMVENVIKTIEKINKNSDKDYSLGPSNVLRMYNTIHNSNVNWRELLQNFLNFTPDYDYTFSPPDRRFSSDFYLPDYNLSNYKQDDINILFLVDTSGSVSDEDLTDSYSEICGAISINPNIKGHIVFFSEVASDMYDFKTIDDLLKIRPYGGGGTSLYNFFNRLDEYKEQAGGKIDAICCLTDGYLPFPKESRRKNIPFIWLINNDDVTPPWGIVARIN